ncbi:MAG TPA: hypothetical protein VGX68_23015 [Thermoanaerobaculia bacterium]|jgi:hypothetical protein|nr:hypothetical protein [Thermoanaerobaculia bacterium]
MRWLAVWVVLTGVYLAGQLMAPLLLGGPWNYTRDDLAHLATVPLAQIVALRAVAWVRRGVRK